MPASDQEKGEEVKASEENSKKNKQTETKITIDTTSSPFTESKSTSEKKKNEEEINLRARNGDSRGDDSFSFPSTQDPPSYHDQTATKSLDRRNMAKSGEKSTSFFKRNKRDYQSERRGTRGPGKGEALVKALARRKSSVVSSRIKTSSFQTVDPALNEIKNPSIDPSIGQHVDDYEDTADFERKRETSKKAAVVVANQKWFQNDISAIQPPSSEILNTPNGRRQSIVVANNNVNNVLAKRGSAEPRKLGTLPIKDPTVQQNSLQKCQKCLKESKYTQGTFYRNKAPFLIICFIYLLLCFVLVGVQYFYLYREANLALRIARCAGILLNLNCCLIILLVMRRLCTWLRNSLIGDCLPVDDFIKYHKFLGVFILVLSVIHTIAHLVNLFWVSEKINKASESALESSSSLGNSSKVVVETWTPVPRDLLDATLAQLVFTSRLGVGWVWGWAIPTGWLLLLILAIIEVCSLPVVRQKGYFQVFYFTHWLHPLFYILLILHCANFWKWFIGPLVLVLFERAYNFVRRRSVKYGDTYIKDVNLLSSKVTQLIITKPANFKFKSGDYLFIRIPKIARYEWHPFTISSAPERDGEIWVHVRSLGNWTNKLYEHFQELAIEANGGSSRSSSCDSIMSTSVSSDNNNSSGIESSGWESDKRKLPGLPSGSKRKNSSGARADSTVSIALGMHARYERRMSNMVVMTNLQKMNEESSDSSNEMNKTHGQVVSKTTFSSSNQIKEDKKAKKEKVETNLNISNNIRNVWMDIQVDGPYSTSSCRILDSEQVILIAGGIGVTPFASILQSLWYKYSKSLKTCSKCDHQWYDDLESKKLKRVDFVWVNRDYQSFEWFIELLGQIELQQLNSQRKRFIGIHLYMTSAKNVQEIRPLDLPDFDRKGQIKKSKHSDNFSLKLIPGRPDLDKLFGNVFKSKRAKDVDVFFCGNKVFGQTVREKSLDYRFKFHKENF